MNKLKYLLSAFVLLCFASCKDDPWEDVADGGWNHERSIIDVKFEGQAGTPTITETDSETGVIELQLASDMVADMSKVRVETLTLSYKATANVASGGTIDFTKGDPQIVVTSPNGESRIYMLEMTEFSETLTGTYTISNLWVYGGTGAAYNCTKLYKPADKSWCWNGEGRGPAAEMDNYLVFTLGEILADGNTIGTCMNWAGEDAKNWDCVFAGASNPDTGKPVDLTQFYRQIPKGESTWLRNYSDGTITFTDADGHKTSCTLVPKGTYQMPNVPPIPLTLESEAFKFNLKGTEDWNNTYNDYGVFARNPVTYYIEIVKQPGRVRGSRGVEDDRGAGRSRTRNRSPIRRDLARRNLLRRPPDGVRRFGRSRVRQPGGQELGVGRFDREGVRQHPGDDRHGHRRRRPGDGRVRIPAR